MRSAGQGVHKARPRHREERRGAASQETRRRRRVARRLLVAEADEADANCLPGQECVLRVGARTHLLRLMPAYLLPCLSRIIIELDAMRELFGQAHGAHLNSFNVLQICSEC